MEKLYVDEIGGEEKRRMMELVASPENVIYIRTDNKIFGVIRVQKNEEGDIIDVEFDKNLCF